MPPDYGGRERTSTRLIRRLRYEHSPDALSLDNLSVSINVTITNSDIGLSLFSTRCSSDPGSVRAGSDLFGQTDR
jgi:hypothetical protein